MNKQKMNEELMEIRNKLENDLKRALRQSWSQLKGHTGIRKVTDLFFTIFNKTIETDCSSETKAIFYKTTAIHAMKNDTPFPVTLLDHAKFIAQFFDYFIISATPSSVRDCQRFTPRLIGKSHACLKESGFDGSLFEKFGQILSEVMVCQPCVKAVPSGRKAWTVVAAILTDKFRAGFEEKVKEMRKDFTKITVKPVVSLPLPQRRQRTSSWSHSQTESNQSNEDGDIRRKYSDSPVWSMVPKVLCTDDKNEEIVIETTQREIMRPRSATANHVELDWMERPIRISLSTPSIEVWFDYKHNDHLLLEQPTQRRRLPTVKTMMSKPNSLTLPQTPSPNGRRSLAATPTYVHSKKNNNQFVFM